MEETNGNISFFTYRYKVGNKYKEEKYNIIDPTSVNRILNYIERNLTKDILKDVEKDIEKIKDYSGYKDGENISLQKQIETLNREVFGTTHQSGILNRIYLAEKAIQNIIDILKSNDLTILDKDYQYIEDDSKTRLDNIETNINKIQEILDNIKISK